MHSNFNNTVTYLEFRRNPNKLCVSYTCFHWENNVDIADAIYRTYIVYLKCFKNKRIFKTKLLFKCLSVTNCTNHCCLLLTRSTNISTINIYIINAITKITRENRNIFVIIIWVETKGFRNVLILFLQVPR